MDYCLFYLCSKRNIIKPTTTSFNHENYIQPNNLLIKFSKDKLDQTKILLKYLKERDNDQTKLIELEGNHLTPAKSSLKEILFDQDHSNHYINKEISRLLDTIITYV